VLDSRVGWFRSPSCDESREMDNALDVLTAALMAVRPTMPKLLAKEWTTDLAA
jgi:hypothetical protein